MSLPKEKIEQLSSVPVHEWKKRSDIYNFTKKELEYILRLADEKKRTQGGNWWGDLRISGSKDQLLQRVLQISDPPVVVSFPEIEVSDNLNQILNLYLSWCENNNFTLFKDDPNYEYRILKVSLNELKHVMSHVETIQEFLEILGEKLYDEDNWHFYPEDEISEDHYDEFDFDKFAKDLLKK